jgi:Domain of unknown function (DUF4352)
VREAASPSSVRASFPGVTGRGTTGIVAVALVALSVLLSSCGSSSSSGGSGSGGPTAQASGPRLGHSVRMHASNTTLIVTVRRVIFPLRGSGMLLSPGDAAAGVDLAIRNSGHGVYDSSSESDISLRTTSGAQAQPGFAQRGQCQTTEIDFLKEVSPGESRNGCVAFDVPKGSKPAAVRFSPEGSVARGRTWVVSG